MNQTFNRLVSPLTPWIGLLIVSAPVSAETAITWKPYGFIHATYIAAERALDTFGYTNLGAPTSVSPRSVLNSHRPRDSFQVAQSRVGVTLQSEKVTGQIEMDWIDFTKASPTTQAYPRLRIANIDYHLSESQTLSMGQCWDLFAAPSKPITYNFVGLYFRAGNLGFMRPQVRYRLQLDSGSSLGIALGLLNKNPGSTDTEIEMTGLPTLALSLSHRFDPTVEMGLSALGGETRGGPYPASLAPIYGVNSFINWESPSGFKLHEAFYYGMNLASAGTLSLAHHQIKYANGSLSPSASRHEVGGYVTALIPISESFSLQGGWGGAQVIESQGSPIDQLEGSTILSNWKAEAALTYRPVQRLSFYLQPTYVSTRYLNSVTLEKSTLNATVLQIGCHYQL